MKNECLSYKQSCIAMAVFGGMAFVLGLVTIISPTYLINMLDLSASENEGLRATVALNGVAAMNMGAYYLYMVYHKVVPFFRITVVFRLLITVPVILYWYFAHGQEAFLSVALWEGIGAFWVLGALWYDERFLDTNV